MRLRRVTGRFGDFACCVLSTMKHEPALRLCSHSGFYGSKYCHNCNLCWYWKAGYVIHTSIERKIPPKTSIIITDQNHNTVCRSVGNNFFHPFCFYSLLNLILVWPVFCVHLWFLEEIQYNFSFKASSLCHCDSVKNSVIYKGNFNRHKHGQM